MRRRGDRAVIAQQVAELFDLAASSLAGTEAAPQLAEARERLTGPLRVAIAGKVKAGKSTLLNALVGERLAPTDAGECTKIVTWYRDGTTYRVTMHPYAGNPEQLPFRREEGSIEIDLRTTPFDTIDRLEIEWPSSALRDVTLIDTPGIDSINTDISARTEQFLTPDGAPRAADAVLYLMRHLHQSDVRFLEAFHDQVAAQPSAINSVGVLSRADEIGVGRLDSLSSAQRIAVRYSNDPKLRRLCQIVIPLAGLLAETAVTLRQDEFRQLQILAAAERSALDALLLSVGRFTKAETNLAITPLERQELLDRFGIFGIRLACGLIRQQRAETSSELSTVLAERSGLDSLRTVLRSHFTARSDVLRARSALLALETMLGEVGPGIDTSGLGRELERVTASIHEFAEVRLLNALRAGHVGLPATDLERAERLLGIVGTFTHERLEADPDTQPAELVALALNQHSYWQTLSENPLLSRDATEAARVLTRTCEGLIAGAQAARS
ncbi:MAG: GTP-binding protein [Actinomycetia bacterium]|nr:GTP-binding protein [Actinomycetes bacterium]